MRQAAAAARVSTISRTTDYHSAAALGGPPEILIATGSQLANAIAAETGQDALAFVDAIAPIVHRDSIGMDVASWLRSSAELRLARTALTRLNGFFRGGFRGKSLNFDCI